jgi:hypothetical protein
MGTTAQVCKARFETGAEPEGVVHAAEQADKSGGEDHRVGKFDELVARGEGTEACHGEAGGQRSVYSNSTAEGGQPLVQLPSAIGPIDDAQSSCPAANRPRKQQRGGENAGRDQGQNEDHPQSVAAWPG